MPWAQSYRQNGTDIVKHTFTFVAVAGVATVASTVAISGQILRVVIDPGSPAPTNLYDMTLTDSDSVDVLAGRGADLSDTATTNICPGTPLKDGTTTSVVPMVVDSILTLNITNAGTGVGTVVVYVR